MRGYKFSRLAAAALALAAPVAQAQVPLEVEGPIENIECSGTSALITVMGMDILVDNQTTITNPTRALALSDLCRTDPLPGREQPGFVGGTAIATGLSFDGFDRIADDLYVEPAENVVLGQVTSNSGGGGLEVEGVPVVMIQDDRMPAIPLVNESGFEIDPNSLAIGTPASMEGYYANGTFYAFRLEADGGSLLDDGATAVSVLRSDCRQRDNGQLEIETRGATHDPPNGTVTVTNPAGTITYGTAPVAPDPDNPSHGAFRFRVRRGGIGECTPEIRVLFVGNDGRQAEVIAPQEVRID